MCIGHKTIIRRFSKSKDFGPQVYRAEQRTIHEVAFLSCFKIKVFWQAIASLCAKVVLPERADAVKAPFFCLKRHQARHAP